MTQLLRHLSPYSQILMAGILVLAGIVVLEIALLDFNSVAMPLQEEGGASGDPATVATKAGGEVVSIPPLPTYRELAARPLFMETRRPAPRETGGTAAAQRIDPGTKWKLTGVIMAGDDSHVFVQGIRDNIVRRLDAGQMLDGWVVSEITPQYVTFTAGAQQSRLELRKEADGG
jgi:hypothetical protein